MLLQSVYLKSIFTYCLILLITSVNQLAYPLTPGFQDTQWSSQQRIPLYSMDTISPPILIADQNRTVHAFSSQWLDDDDDNNESRQAIIYNRWSLAQGWTVPIDILISPTNKGIRITDAYLDKNGIFHVVFFGGDNTAADIYYSNAPAALADNTRAWSTPLIIGKNAGDPEGAVFVEDDEGALYVIYNGRQLGYGLYVVKSTDDGESWSDPNPIFFNPIDEPNTVQLRVIKGKSGKFHVILGCNNTAGQGRGIYYLNTEDGSELSDPIVLAEAYEGFGVLKPTIIEHNDTLFALYIVNGKVTMRQSSDDGKTWDIPLIIFPRHEGVNGDMSLVIDSNNVLHLFWAQRTSPTLHGMWHSEWVNNRWVEPEAIVKGLVNHDQVGYDGFDPNFARAVISQGNVALVTWRTDPRAKPNGIWYSYKILDTPELPIVPIPTVQQAFSPNVEFNTRSTAVPSPSSIPEQLGLELRDYAKQDTSNKPARPIVVAVIISMIFLFIVIGVVVFANRQ